MQIFVNFPKTQEEIKLFVNNLAIVKAELILKSVENIDESEEVKDKVLKKIIEILNKDSVIQFNFYLINVHEVRVASETLIVFKLVF